MAHRPPGRAHHTGRSVLLLLLAAWLVAAPARAGAATAGHADTAPLSGPDAGPGAARPGPRAPAATGAANRLDVAPASARFTRASEILAAGDHAAAQAAFRALAEQLPADRLAPDALFTAAQLAEEPLGRVDEARQLYQQLVMRYPHSRVALAAQRHLTRLGQELGGDPASAGAAAAYRTLLRQLPTAGEAATIAGMEALIARYPAWPALPRALLWLAEAHLRSGDLARARALYLRVAAAGGAENASRGFRGAGDVELLRGAHEAARALYRQMPADGDPGREHARTAALEALERAVRRWRRAGLASAWLLAVLVALLALLRSAAGSWHAAVGRLRPVPGEVLYLAPVLALLAGIAYTDHDSIGPALVQLGLGTLTLTWLSGAGLRAAAPSPWRPLLHAILGATGVAALCYLILYRGDLLDLVAETLAHGPD